MKAGGMSGEIVNRTVPKNGQKEPHEKIIKMWKDCGYVAFFLVIYL